LPSKEKHWSNVGKKKEAEKSGEKETKQTKTTTLSAPMSKIRSARSNESITIVCELPQCVDASNHTGRLVLLRERRQLFFYASRDTTDVVHLADVAFVKLALPRLIVVTNTRLVSFQSPDSSRLRAMAAAIKGELSCSHLLAWFAADAHVRYHDAPSLTASLLLRAGSSDRVVAPSERFELQASIESLRRGSSLVGSGASSPIRTSPSSSSSTVAARPDSTSTLATVATTAASSAAAVAAAAANAASLSLIDPSPPSPPPPEPMDSSVRRRGSWMQQQ
jgi:hypothetical protein